MGMFSDAAKVIKLIKDYLGIKAKKGPRVDVILPPPPRVPSDLKPLK
jgi:hypothetical protein